MCEFRLETGDNRVNRDKLSVSPISPVQVFCCSKLKSKCVLRFGERSPPKRARVPMPRVSISQVVPEEASRRFPLSLPALVYATRHSSMLNRLYHPCN